MIQSKPIGFQAQNNLAEASDISDNPFEVSVPVEIVAHIFTFLTENSKNLLNLRSVCSRFKAIIETEGNCKRFFKMSTSKDPLFQNSSKISNYLSKFLLHLTPCLTSREGVYKLLISPSFKDRFAITILNIFLQKVLRNPISPTDKQALLEKVDHLKTHLYISIISPLSSPSFELQEKQNQEIINPLLKLFIKLGVDPTVINRQGFRSLFKEALDLQNTEGMRIILKALKNQGVTEEELPKKLNENDNKNYLEIVAYFFIRNAVSKPYYNRNKVKEASKLLFQCGADLSFVQNKFNSSLREMYFTDSRSEIEIKKILKQIFSNTEENLKNLSNQSEKLHAAIKDGNKGEIEKFLQDDKNLINHPDTRQEMTPLMHALYCGDLEIVKFILSYNPDITLLDKIRYSVFHHCVSGGLEAEAKIDILKNLIQRAESIECQDMIAKAVSRVRPTPFDLAIISNRFCLEIVKLLLPYCLEDINQKPYLHKAIGADKIEVVRLLLKAGAKINSHQPDHDITNTLSYAVFKGNVEITKLLLKFDTDSREINAKYKTYSPHKRNMYNHPYKMPPLCVATKNLNLEMMKLLLSQEKIDLHIQDDQDHTPLDIAMESGYHEGAKLLIQRGAQTKLSETTKILSAEGPHFDKLRQHLLYVFIENKDLDSLQLLLNSPFDLQLTTINKDFGKSPIMYAKEIDPKIVQMIHRIICNKSNRSGNYSN
ncbi:ankyrin repeat domain-containing F-box protein [Candidatus Protochlamydia sp. W-9]|uniref:ankyrin repeat domain-containing F-box protein n=1 Tax=Candidatus Protochlamydia sp. W-9 TaxID=1785087 RepID=UPI00096ACA49|nr:ankyrin repeat domain-containing F-box protein [Candidatus Protochlamydia sp. W-9]